MWKKQSSRMLTVEEAVQILGLTRRAVVELIGDGTLPWRMAADKKTVIVEVPCDVDGFLRAIGASGHAGDVTCPPSSPSSPRSTVTTRRRKAPSLTDVDAWSQPK